MSEKKWGSADAYFHLERVGCISSLRAFQLRVEKV